MVCAEGKSFRGLVWKLQWPLPENRSCAVQHAMKGSIAILKLREQMREDSANQTLAETFPSLPALSGIEGEREFRVHQDCFKIDGLIFRTELPALTHLPTAA